MMRSSGVRSVVDLALPLDAAIEAGRVFEMAEAFAIRTEALRCRFLGRLGGHRGGGAPGQESTQGGDDESRSMHDWFPFQPPL